MTDWSNHPLYELRRHATPLRLTLLAVFGHLREREITDTLVDLLLNTVHRIGARAERRVERELLEDLKRVVGKNGLLFQLAEASLAQPDGVVKLGSGPAAPSRLRLQAA